MDHGEFLQECIPVYGMVGPSGMETRMDTDKNFRVLILSTISGTRNSLVSPVHLFHEQAMENQ